MDDIGFRWASSSLLSLLDRERERETRLWLQAFANGGVLRIMACRDRVDSSSRELFRCSLFFLLLIGMEYRFSSRFDDRLVFFENKNLLSIVEINSILKISSPNNSFESSYFFKLNWIRVKDHDLKININYCQIFFDLP